MARDRSSAGQHRVASTRFRPHPSVETPNRRRAGKVLILVVISFSAILGIVGLVFDTGLVSSETQNLKQVTDAAATAGAMDLRLGKSASTATATSTVYARDLNGPADVQTTINTPPSSGPYAGRVNYLEVLATRQYETRFMHLVGATRLQTIAARSVAGLEPATVGGAVVVLDPDPSPVALTGVPLGLPTYPAIVGGLEVLGIGSVRVDGAVLVNTNWGGVDEDGNPAGNGPGPPYGISCTPLLALSRLDAVDIRVAGGVDNPANYGSYDPDGTSPLQANRLPVPDPFLGLPAPSTDSDPTNVSTDVHAGTTILTLPVVITTLEPGVYEWIEVVAGNVIFEPGVYIIRGVNPSSGIGLNLTGGTITATGVMFYITNSAGYSAETGAPDSGDGESKSPVPAPEGLTPSVIINAALVGSNFSPLSDSNSPFDGMLVYQRRVDPRPIVVVHQGLLGGGSVGGTLYAKWGHVVFTGAGTYDLRIVAGTARLNTALGMTIAPQDLLPPAQDVFLVE